MARIGYFWLVIATAVLVGCGGKQSVASKSAAAYRGAVEKGIPVEGGGHEHGATGKNMSGMEHSEMKGMANMPGMQHGSMQGMKNMPGMRHGSMQGMKNMPGMQHGSMQGMANMPGMQHGSMQGMANMPGMQHGSMQGMANMPGMQHGSMQGMANMPGMKHGSPSAASVIIAGPSTNSAIAQLSPSSTLKEDALDAPKPVAVEEAKRASSPQGHQQ